MYPVPELNDVEFVFPSSERVMKDLSIIPREFYDHNNPYHKFTSRIFSRRGWEGHRFVPRKMWEGCGFVPRKGVDRADSIRAISVVLRGMDFRHEDKIASAAFLFAEWFRAILVDTGDGYTHVLGEEVEVEPGFKPTVVDINSRGSGASKACS